MNIADIKKLNINASGPNSLENTQVETHPS